MPEIDCSALRSTFGDRELPPPFADASTVLAAVSGTLAASGSLFAKLTVESKTLYLSSYLMEQLAAAVPTLPRAIDVASQATVAHVRSLASSTLPSHYSSVIIRSIGDASSAPAAADLMHYALRAVFATLIFVSNAGMWATFTKALNKSSDSVSVSVVSSATNLIVTAILGFLVFGEPLSLLWAFGASLIFLGTILMGSNSSDAKIHAE